MKYCLLFVLLILVFPVHAQSPRYAKVISENANLRELPTATSTSIIEVPDETLVKVLDEKLPWYVVRIASRVGWMHGDTLEFISSRGSDASPEISTSDIAPVAPRRPSTPRTGGTGGYIRGPRGGCYYISSSGRKVYVDRSMCN